MRLLLIEDNDDDAELVLLSLRRSGLDLDVRLVASRDTLASALNESKWSVILSDFNLGDDFTGLDALGMVRAVDPDVPFIIVSATIGEEMAIEVIRAGANDYVMKDRIKRLVPAIERELRDVQLRQERRALFEALRRSEEKYRRIFEKAPIGVAVSTASGSMMTANERFHSIFGFDGVELAGMPVWHLLQADRTSAQMTPASHSTRQVQRYRRRNGEAAWASVTAAPVTNESGIIEQFVWLVEDITAHRAAEERLALQAMLLDAVEQAVITTDLAGRIIYWNRYAETLYGWKADEAFGSGVFELTAGADSDAAAAILEENRSGGSWLGEIELCRRDGSAFSAWLMATPIRDANGNLAAVVMVSHDRTAQKLAQDELRSSREQLSVAQSIARIGSWEIDPSRGQRDWSDELLRIYGFKPGSDVSLADFDSRLHPDDRERVRSARAEISNGLPRFAFDYRIVLPNGETRMLHATGGVVCQEAALSSKVAGIVQDVTEIRAQEQELENRFMQQEAVANLGQAALSGCSLDTLYRLASSIIVEVLHVDLCEILAKDESGFRIAGGLGWNDNVFPQQRVTPEAASQALYTLQRAEPVFVHDLARETRFAAPALLQGHGIVSGVTVPMIGGDARPWGVLGAHMRTHRQFTRGDADFLRTIAGVLGQAVMRRRVEDELRLRAMQQTAISELSRLALKAEARQLFAAACNVIKECLGVDGAAVIEGGDPDLLWQQGIEPELRPSGGEWSAAVLISTPGTLFGVLSATSSRPRTYSDAEIEFLQSLANIIAEVVERERGSAALAESERRYREVVEGASEVIFGISADGRFSALNAAFEQVTGWPAREWIGRRYLDLVAERDRERSSASLARIVATGTASAAQIPIHSRFGERVIEVTSFPKVENGRVTAIYGFARDVTDAQRIEIERLQLTRNLQLLLESTAEGILTFDLGGVCTMSNAAAARILGRPSNELVAMEVHALLHPAEHALADCPIVRVAHSGQILSSVRATFLSAAGTEIPVEYSAAPVLDNQIPIGVVVSFSDIRDRLGLESKLEQANRVASLGRLAATVAHEFNNVLMSMTPFLEMIRRGRNVPAAVEQITRSIQRGKRVTADILRFTQPAEPVRATFAVEGWLQNIAFEARSLLSARWNVNIDAVPAHLRIEGDANQLHQIFANLVLNARDAMPDGGQLTIRVKNEQPGTRFPFGVVEHPERYVHFIVADSGHGMAPETLRHIFEPLFTTKKNGTGLGLAVTHQVVMRHGGEIFVESEAARGTAFHIFLPLSTAGVESAAAIAASSAPKSSAAYRVLLVEDDEAVASGLRDLLELEGFAVTLAGTGTEALALAGTASPEVVVLDIGLPDMDGMEVFERLDAKYPHLPIVFSTGHGDRTRLDAIAAERDAVAYLLKPYDSQLLVDAIREVAV